MYFQSCSTCLALLVAVIRVRAFNPEVMDSRFIMSNLADINIGAIMSFHSNGSDKEICGPIIYSKDFQIHADALKFAVEKVNENRNFLPDFNLGYVILDDCFSNQMSLARSLQFMPKKFRNERCQTCAAKPKHDTRNATMQLYYDVVGVIGAFTSERTKIVANVMSLFKIPHISYSSTADVLSDKRQYSYFLRTITPDRYQVHTMADLLVHYNWTFVSAVYSKGTYGRGAISLLEKELSKRKICIATVLETNSDMKETDYDKLIADLRKYKRARVVIAYLEVEEAQSFITALTRNDAIDDFYILGSDAFFHVFDKIRQSRIGVTMVLPYSENSIEFDKYMREKPMSYPDQHGGMNEHIEQVANVSTMWTSLIIDSVWVFARALDTIIKTGCKFQSNLKILKCIQNGSALLEAVLNVTFNGTSGYVHFDKNGDIYGRFQIIKMLKTNGRVESRRIGTWDRRTESFEILEHDDGSDVESSCGKPCPVGYGYVPTDGCCFDCEKCEDNEIVQTNANNVSSCTKCKNFTWPNENRTLCNVIKPEAMAHGAKISVILSSFSVLGIVATLVTSAIYINNRNKKLIRSTSRELSSMILVGILLQFAVVFSMASYPTRFTCYVNYIGMSLTCTAVYAPLMIKIIRVYRIFRSGKKSTTRPTCTRPWSQVIISILVIAAQAILIVVTLVTTPTYVNTRMPEKLKRLVEKYCYMPISGFLTVTSYNMILVAICTYFAFKTRKLPDNFNETRYIAFCIDTTCLLWISFIPTYFTMPRAIHHATFSSGMLILQGFVWLSCLFWPKIMALIRNKKNGCVQSNDKSNLSIHTMGKKLPSDLSQACIEMDSSTNPTTL